MAPNLSAAQRHGSVWFDVSGFGRLRRDFMVDDPEALFKAPETHAAHLVRQVRLLDKTLPNSEINCRPVKIDLVVCGVRRILDGSGRVLFEQK